MKIAMLGLGKMGGNMSARLIRNGISVVGYDNNPEIIKKLENNNLKLFSKNLISGSTCFLIGIFKIIFLDNLDPFILELYLFISSTETL